MTISPAALSSRPSALSRRMISATKKGLPSDFACTASTSASSGSRPAVIATYRATCARVSPRNAIRRGGRTRVLPVELRVAVRADDEKACVTELRSEELEQHQRRPVGALQVVEHHHQRLAARGVH